MRHPLPTLALILAATLPACVTTDEYNKPIDPRATPTPGAPPPKETPMPVYNSCRVSNNAGRIFVGADPDRDIAERRARKKCGLFSRNCTLLSCTVTYDGTE